MMFAKFFGLYERFVNFRKCQVIIKYPSSSGDLHRPEIHASISLFSLTNLLLTFDLSGTCGYLLLRHSLALIIDWLKKCLLSSCAEWAVTQSISGTAPISVLLRVAHILSYTCWFCRITYLYYPIPIWIKEISFKLMTNIFSTSKHSWLVPDNKYLMPLF